METRKLQKVGGGTYTVSIPKAWATAHHLEAGAPVHVYPHDDGTLVVRSTRRDEEPIESATLALDPVGPTTVERALNAAYAAGFREVTLTAETFTTEQRRAASAFASTLAGAEVVSETETEITVRNFLDSAAVSIRQAVDQLRFLALGAHRAATADANGDDAARRERIRQREDDVRRFLGMVTHHFARALASLAEVDELGVERPALFAYYRTARELAAVVRHAETVADRLDELVGDVPPALAPSIEASAESAGDVVERGVSAVLNEAAFADAAAIRDDADAVVERIDETRRALYEAGDPSCYPLASVLDALERTAKRGGSIADVAAGVAIREDA